MCGEIYKITEEINRTEIISSDSTLNTTNIINDSFDLMHLERSNNVGCKPKLRCCTQFKQDDDAEKYIKFSFTRSHRSLLAQLRMRILPFEDEYHFLCCCAAYNSERDQLYRKLKTIYPDFDSWNLNEKFIIFVEKIWNIRQSIVLN